LTNRFGFILDSMPERQEIFKLIQKHAKISDREMYSTFNMGVGLCVVVPKGTEDTVIDIFRRHGMRSDIIGRIVDMKGVYIDKLKIC
jgi:phosphoribosylformylglycinamidine cyclo-ligase